MMPYIAQNIWAETGLKLLGHETRVGAIHELPIGDVVDIRAIHESPLHLTKIVCCHIGKK